MNLNSKAIPRLIIQPIVENSVIHGLEKLIGDKQIDIICQNDPPIITIIDTVIHMSRIGKILIRAYIILNIHDLI